MATPLAAADAVDKSPASATLDTGALTGAPITTRPGRWIDGWNPEDAGQWESAGKAIARRNLVLSIFAEFLGFAVWAVWSIVVPQLAGVGFVLSVDQTFWLIAVPSLVGATLRIPYTFAVPLFGGRNWTIISALLLLIPTIGLGVVVQNPEWGFPALLAVACLAGVGGGNFASSMANISFFYPEKEKGRALGLNAAGGNLGTAAVQWAVPIVIAIGAGVSLERAGFMFVPLAILSAVLAWKYMNNLSNAKSDPRSYGVATKSRHTWILSFIYIGTFGSFIGFAGAFPTLLKGQFPDVTISIAFAGALVGSLARPLGGILADKLGGARVTIAAFAIMGAGVVCAIFALRAHSFGAFLASFLVLFTATGAGNGSVYRMIPAVFSFGVTDDADRQRRIRAAAGAIGIAGAIGAFGGFLVPRGFAVSTTMTGNIQAALWAIVGFYVVTGLTTWFVYQRRSGKFGSTVI